MSKQNVIGYYNEMEYRVAVNSKDVYTAGNSPVDSQAYTTKENGVGLDTMRKYCEYTAREIAKEKHAKYIGVEYEEYEDTV